jgi:hypothetical protein
MRKSDGLVALGLGASVPRYAQRLRPVEGRSELCVSQTQAVLLLSLSIPTYALTTRQNAVLQLFHAYLGTVAICSGSHLKSAGLKLT